MENIPFIAESKANASGQNEAGVSPIEGLGIFAAEEIKAGQVVWEFCEGLDLRLTLLEFEQLPTLTQEYLKWYCHWCEAEQRFYLSCDNDRFTNHADFSNAILQDKATGSGSSPMVAARNIDIGEEILFDCREIDDNYRQQEELLFQLSGCQFRPISLYSTLA